MTDYHDEWMGKISEFMREHDLKEVKIKGKDHKGEKHKLEIEADGREEEANDEMAMADENEEAEE